MWIRWGLLGWLSGCLAIGMIALSSGAAQAEDETRLKQIRVDLASTGVYLEPTLAQGDPELWRGRLEAALAGLDPALPMQVALWVDIPGVAPVERPEHGWSATFGTDQPIITSLGLVSPQQLTPRYVALIQQMMALEFELEARAPDLTRYSGLAPVARAWLTLRLAAREPATVPELVAELGGDPSLLVDRAKAPSDVGQAWDPFGPHIAWALLPLSLTAAAFALLNWPNKRDRNASAQPRRDPILDSLTPLALETAVADLSEAIARSDVRPGEPAYDRAQACLDAAAQYVDAEADRDRIGVHLLVADAHRHLSGLDPEQRCFFNPFHLARTTVQRNGATIPCCAHCAKSVAAGTVDGALLVGTEGTARPYFEVDDVWTLTGYGALEPRWAKRALLASLEGR